jgi:hypothetical protein
LACETDEDRARGVVERLARELPLQAGESADEAKLRIRTNLAPFLADEFELSAPAVGVGNDRSFALTAAVEIDRLFPLRALELDGARVLLSKSGRRAAIRGTARAATQPGDLHAFDVAFDTDLEKDGETWRVARVSLSDPLRPLPEERP